MIYKNKIEFEEGGYMLVINIDRGPSINITMNDNFKASLIIDSIIDIGLLDYKIKKYNYVYTIDQNIDDVVNSCLTNMAIVLLDILCKNYLNRNKHVIVSRILNYIIIIIDYLSEKENNEK